MNAIRKTPATLADTAYNRLRADLLACRYRPGEPIRINEVCVVMDTNLSAVREALSRLSSEGLVVSEPQKGYRAAPISADELRDLTMVRIEIESLCLRRSVALGDLNWEADIAAAQHRLQRTPLRLADDPLRINDDWARNHAVYHLALVAACDSPWLLRLRETLYAQSERYRRLSLPLADFERDVDREHQDIARALLARDAPLASALMTRHLQVTTDILLRNTALFAGDAEAEPAPRRRAGRAEG